MKKHLLTLLTASMVISSAGAFNLSNISKDYDNFGKNALTAIKKQLTGSKTFIGNLFSKQGAKLMLNAYKTSPIKTAKQFPKTTVVAIGAGALGAYTAYRGIRCLVSFCNKYRKTTIGTAVTAIAAIGAYKYGLYGKALTQINGLKGKTLARIKDLLTVKVVDNVSDIVNVIPQA
ncbi:hypothetical protein HOL34_04045 [bacterium]|jgi:hypothetical protein|nr:hypothetical protein [bacterium]MBT3903247.1 hypothetical protein [bacterium]MBT4578141.1 hypothetical protein [bacterium]MBT5345571.1 hypothetical protein [bacterium]MBT6131070.1 hypothetical protein [bacterium]